MKKFISICCVISFMLLAIFSAVDNKNMVYAVTELDVSAKAYIVSDDNGNVLFEKNADAKLQVASIVKLMTTLLTLESLDDGLITLQDKVVASEHAASMGGSQVFVDAYSEYMLGDMLKSVIVASANDASVVLAEYIAGNEENFVSRMNQRAKELKMDKTFYENSTGLPTPSQYSTARDTSILLKEVLKHNLYKNYSNIWMDELIHPSGRKTELVNTNKLIRYYKGCDGGKTGFTDEAGYCLSATAEKDGFRLISVCLGSESNQARFNDSAILFNYGFANFERKCILKANDILQKANVKLGVISNIGLGVNQDYYITTKKGKNDGIDISFNYDNNIMAPINKNDILGEITISKDGVVLDIIDLVALDSIEKINLLDSLSKIKDNWSIL